MALGDYHLTNGGVVRAIGFFQQALSSEEGNTAARRGLTASRLVRNQWLDQCLTENVLERCRAARIVGAADQFRIEVQIGDILVRSGREKDGMEWWIRAQNLNVESESLAKRIAGRSEDGLGIDPQVLNRAKARAHRVLGNEQSEVFYLNELLVNGWATEEDDARYFDLLAEASERAPPLEPQIEQGTEEESQIDHVVAEPAPPNREPPVIADVEPRRQPSSTSREPGYDDETSSPRVPQPKTVPDRESEAAVVAEAKPAQFDSTVEPKLEVGPDKAPSRSSLGVYANGLDGRGRSY